jgi:hypothetical protein
LTELKIRTEQMAILDESFLREWCRGELIKLFPQRCAALGRTGLVKFIAAGATRAHKLQLKRDDLLPYLSMEICFGEDFVAAESNRWARQALEGPIETRMQRLRRAGIFRLAERVETERRQKAARDAAERQSMTEQREAPAHG